VNDFKNGVTVEIDGVPYRVLGEHLGTGRTAELGSDQRSIRHSNRSGKPYMRRLTNLVVPPPPPPLMHTFTPAEFLHVKPGKGAAFVRSKLRNLLTNSNQEKTFRGGETIGLADVNRREGQFTYADGDQVRRGGFCVSVCLSVWNRGWSSPLALTGCLPTDTPHPTNHKQNNTINTVCVYGHGQLRGDAAAA
jgi:hypothetical protein